MTPEIDPFGDTMTFVRVSRPGAGTRSGMIVAGLLFLVGCTTNKPKPAAPTPPSPAPVASQPTFFKDDQSTQRVHDLGREADNFAADCRMLPGRDAAEHSRIMQRIFTDLIQILPLLSGPNEDRGLRQRLSIIASSRSQLANGSVDIAMDVAIDTALLSAHAALADISHSDRYSQADVGPSLDKLSAQVNRLDLERNSNLHRIDVADASDTMSQVVSKLAAALGGRIVAEPSATKPATASDGR